MKSTTFPLSALVLILALPPARVLASEAIPFRFLVPAVTVQETDSVARLQVLRADDADHPISVDFLTEPGNATPDVDYTPVAGTLTFSPGEHFKLIEVPILNDGFTESGETFRVVLTRAAELGISETFGSATVTIRDNDPGFSFETSTYRPDESQSEVVLNVRRGSDRPGTITVDYAVEADNATAGSDYRPVSGTLSFGPNDLLQVIRVPILQDVLKETVETFRVLLSNPSAGASLGIPNTATVRLTDNDPGFTFDGSTYTVSEGQGEAVLYVFRGTDLPGEISVEYSIESISATPDLDYIPVSGTLIFPAEHASKVIRIPILNDGLKESVETFRVRLSNPSTGAFLGTPSAAIVRIESNDSGFSFSGGSSYSFDENGRAFLSVERGSDLLAEISVEYTVEPVSATPELDYTPVSGKLVFTTNTYAQTIEIPILDDRLKESTESFRVLLRNPSPGTSLGSPSVATVRILASDPGFSFDSSSYFIAEGGPVTLRVYRGANPIGEASVDYSVEADADSATAGVDYTPVSGTLTFLDQEIYQTIQIPTLNDSLPEGIETFRVILSNPGPGSSLGSPVAATVRIIDNEPGFSLGWVNSPVVENSGEVALIVYRNGDASRVVSVDYSVEPDTASPDLDYTAVRGTVVFAAQETSKTISVPILNDMISEGNESFSVVLSNPSAGTFIGTPNRANVTIQDNDIGFAFECTPGNPYCDSPPENSGAARVDVVIRGDFKFTNTVSIDFFTQPATATANVDFLATAGTLTFAPGETRKTLSIPLLNDGLFEAPETFRIMLQNPVGLTQAVALPRFTFTIQDNERGYWIEGNTEDGRLVLPRTSGDVRINVRREGDFNYRSSVNFRTSEAGEEGSTAVPGLNFVAAAGTISFAPGETNQVITLRLIGARRVRVVEQFFIQLSNPVDGVGIKDGLRWIEIRPDEHNLLQVDPGFSSEVPYARATDLQVFPDGRIVMATPLPFLTGEDGLGIVRLLRDGALDPSFRLATTSGFNRLALQANDQVLVGGPPELTINGGIVGPLARLNADGSFDSTFRAQVPKPTNSSVTALAAQSDGKILVATDQNLLVRLNPNGSLDRSFPSLTDAPISRIGLDKSGRALISGDFTTVENQPRPGLARLLSDGSLDRSFLADWPFGPVSLSALEAEETFLITYANGLGRLTPDGRLDPTFKADARLESFPYFSFPAPHGKVLISEQKAFEGPGIDSGLVSRLNPDGSFDESFAGETYTVTFQPTGGWSLPSYSISADPGGDLIIKGDIASVNGIPTAGIGRLLINGGLFPVTVDPASAQVLETNGLVNVTLVRMGNTSSAYTVNWATDGGTALPGVDFLAARGTVTFAPGESDHAISLQLLDNSQLDGDRTVRLRLTTLDGRVLPPVTFTIANDDLGFVPGGSHAFSNGRFLMTLTGHRTRPNVSIQRTDDPRWWQDWMSVTPSGNPQIIDYEAPTESGARQLYRLVEY